MQDLGHFYDQGFSLIDPYLLYGIFQRASALAIDPGAMQRRLHRIKDVFPAMERAKLDQQAKGHQLNDMPQFTPLFALCR